MEEEFFFSGYCRMSDGSRTVAVTVEDGKLTEADCNFEHCLYAPACPIGKAIREKLNP